MIHVELQRLVQELHIPVQRFEALTRAETALQLTQTVVLLPRERAQRAGPRVHQRAGPDHAE